MQFPHTGVSPLIQLLGVTILKWDFFFGAGDINWCLIWSIGSHFPKKIKQTTDGLRRELPKALFLNHNPLPTWFQTSGSYFLNSQMGIFHLHFY